jgi:hypothetical protein
MASLPTATKKKKKGARFHYANKRAEGEDQLIFHVPQKFLFSLSGSICTRGETANTTLYSRRVEMNLKSGTDRQSLALIEY